MRHVFSLIFYFNVWRTNIGISAAVKDYRLYAGNMVKADEMHACSLPAWVVVLVWNRLVVVRGGRLSGERNSRLGVIRHTRTITTGATRLWQRDGGSLLISSCAAPAILLYSPVCR